MIHRIHTPYQTFERVELAEDVYQGLLASLSARLFPGFVWVEFKAAVESPYGVAHPDACLLNCQRDEWWVVEIELARHAVETHVSLQLQKLRNGWYGGSHKQYVADHRPDVKELLSKIEFRRPRFLTIVDDYSSMILSAAIENGFETAYIVPYRTDARSGLTLYAATVDGKTPVGRGAHAPKGIVVKLRAERPVARLQLVLEDQRIPEKVSYAIVGTRMVRAWVEPDQQGMVIALGSDEVHALIGRWAQYMLTYEDEGVVRVTAVSEETNGYSDRDPV